MPQRDVLGTIGRDRAGLGIYLFGVICRKPQDPKAPVDYQARNPGASTCLEVPCVRPEGELPPVEGLKPSDGYLQGNTRVP